MITTNIFGDVRIFTLMCVIVLSMSCHVSIHRFGSILNQNVSYMWKKCLIVFEKLLKTSNFTKAWLSRNLVYMVFCTSSFFSSTIDRFLFLFFFFKTGIHSMQGWRVTTRHRVTRKKPTKMLKHTGKLIRKKLQFGDVC